MKRDDFYIDVPVRLFSLVFQVQTTRVNTIARKWVANLSSTEVRLVFQELWLSIAPDVLKRVCTWGEKRVATDFQLVSTPERSVQPQKWCSTLRSDYLKWSPLFTDLLPWVFSHVCWLSQTSFYCLLLPLNTPETNTTEWEGEGFSFPSIKLLTKL